MAVPRRRPHVASPEEVRITRDGDAAIIEYCDPNVATTHLTIGAEKLGAMTDAVILELWNSGIEATDEMRRSITYVATEIPIGQEQLENCDLSGHRVARGEIVRCVIEGTPESEGDVFVSVDGKDLTLMEFARIFERFAGWGMRVEIVPDDEIHLRPRRRVKEPKKKGRSVFRRRRAAV